MDWQLILVGLCVVAAAGFVARQTWRTWASRAKAGCGGCGKGCSPASPTPRLISTEDLTARLRDRG